VEWIILHEVRAQGNLDDVGRKILRKLLTYLPTKKFGLTLQRIAVFIFTTKNTPNITRTKKVTFKMLAVVLCKSTCTATLWRVRLRILLPGKAIIPSFCIVVGVDVALRYVKMFNVAMVM
jgi:hypothetical protein